MSRTQPGRPTPTAPQKGVVPQRRDQGSDQTNLRPQRLAPLLISTMRLPIQADPGLHAHAPQTWRCGECS